MTDTADDTIAAVLMVPGEAPAVIKISTDIEAFWEVLGGYIEGAARFAGVVAWCNEDGKRIGLAPNEQATTWLHMHGRLMGDWIAGPLLVTGADGPSETDVPGWVIEELGLEADATGGLP